MPEPLALALALLALAAALMAAVARVRWLPEWVAACAGAAVLVGIGAIGLSATRRSLGNLGPTVGFLAALLVLADGCRREGVFEALGQLMARRSGSDPRRLLALVFIVAAVVTAVLGLDATVVLLTPVVFATAARLRTSPRPHVYACSHLANSGSLLLVVSNLTNLLAFRAAGLSFTRFAALMALPWLAAVGVEWVVLRRFFARELAGQPGETTTRVASAAPTVPLPAYPLVVLVLTLTGFVISSPLAVAPVWFAAAGAAAISLPALARGHASLPELVRAAEPGFLAFVLGLGVIVAAAGHNGLHSAVAAVLPRGHSLPDLLAIAALSALLANLLNNLPATLILLTVTGALGPAAVLAMLIGVGIGPNLTYAGSLATLLWRRVLHARDAQVQLREFTLLGLLTVPAAIIAATILLWVAARYWS